MIIKWAIASILGIYIEIEGLNKEIEDIFKNGNFRNEKVTIIEIISLGELSGRMEMTEGLMNWR